MGKKLTLTLAVGMTLTLGIAAIANALETPYISTCLRSPVTEGSDCPGLPDPIANFGAGVVPKKLPSHEVAPVAIKLWGKVFRDGGTHPSALREMTIDFDRNIEISARGLPVCHSGHRDPIERNSIPKACDNSIIGGGEADFELAFPEAPLVLDSSKLTVYNGGVKGGVTNLYVVALIDVPVPRTIAVPVEIKRIHKGRYGLRAVAKIPVIAGGSGSLLDFRLKIKRVFNYKGLPKSYAMARCPNRQLRAEISAVFKNEAHEPGVTATTQIKGGLVSPCTPTKLNTN